MDRVARLGVADAGEVLTLQRAAYVTEAQAHGDLDLPPLRQVLPELAAVRARVSGSPQATAQIGRLTVAPDRQGQRLGTRLLDASRLRCRAP